MGSIRVDHGLKPKDLIGIPWRVAFALQADGWYLRSSIIWHKPNPMPESVTDRPTSAHENIFLFAKSQRYFYDAEAVKEESSTFGRQNTNGLSPKMLEKQALGHVSAKTGMVDPYAYEKRNLRNVWTIPTEPFPGSHFAVFPPALIEPCIKAGCPVGGTVLDPFGGAGTTGLVADRLGRNALLIELNPEYAEMARRRIEGDAGMFAGVGLEAAE
jgi:DNA modification methylase